MTKEATPRLGLTAHTRLTLYLYGWMLSCLIPKLPVHPDSVHPSRASGRVSETTATFSHAAAPPVSILGREDIATYESSESNRPMSHPVPAPVIPVAQMLLVRGVEQSNAQSPTSCAATETSQDAHEDNSAANADAAASEWDEYQPPAAPQRRIKHRGDSANACSFPRNKRQKHSHHGTARSSVVAKTRNMSYSRTGYEEGVEEDEASSYPSPPDIEAETPLGGTENILNFPNIHGSGSAAADELQWAPGRATETDTIALREPGGARQSSSTNTNSAPVEQPSLREVMTVNPNEDVDPITGELEPPYPLAGHIERPPNASARPTLVVPIKLTPTTRDTHMLRKKLASKLAHIRRTGLSNPNILLLRSTVELLETLSKVSYLRLREIYQDTFNHYQGALKQWLGLLNNVIIFYEMTGFKGNLSERDAFLQAMPEGCPVAVEDAFIHGSADLEEWLHNSGIDGATFAQEVASLLVHLGLWDTWMNQDRIEKTTTQFTLDLLAWYGSS